MQTVCLIIPPSLFLLDERVFMTLGILKVAAVLEKAGTRVEMLDLSGVSNFEEAAAVHAASSSASVFGITSTTPQMPAAFRLAAAIRERRPDARLVLGGPHPTLINAGAKCEARTGHADRARKALEQLLATYDCVVAGDGEEAIMDAIKPGAPRLIDADDASSPYFLSSARLNELPFPARHLMDVGSYHYSIEGVPALSIIAQLGCPFQCGFCGGRSSPMLRRVRMRTKENIVAEISELHRSYGTRGFMLYDDELNVNPRMIELMEAIRAEQGRLGVEFRLRGFIKSELFNDRQAEAMFKAGFRWVLVGFESGSPRILDNIRKIATREDNTRCLETARRHGLKVKALMSVGHPGEDDRTVAETRDWLLATRPDDFDVTLITTYPGTPYFDEAVRHPDREGVWTYTCKKSGDRLHSYEVDYTRVSDYFKGDPNGGYKAYIFTDALSAEDLVARRDALERGVRAELGIPFNPAGSQVRYEHSMGQGQLPPSILRVTGGA